MKIIVLWFVAALCCNNLNASSIQNNSSQKVHLSVWLDTNYRYTSLQLLQYDDVSISTKYTPVTQIIELDKNSGTNSLVFSIPVNRKYSYITLVLINNDATNLLHAQTVIAGDSINLRVTSGQPYNKFTFSGDHADFYNCQAVINSSTLFTGWPSLNGEGSLLKDPFKPGIDFLAQYRSKIHRELYDFLFADLIGRITSEWVQNYLLNVVYVAKDSFYINNAKRSLIDIKKRFESFSVPNEAKMHSAFYAMAIADTEFSLARGNKKSAGNYSNMLKIAYQPLKEKVLACFVYQDIVWLGDSDSQRIMRDIPAHIKSDNYVSLINKFINGNSVGKPAYNFSLPDNKGNYYRQDDFKGKVVFIDFYYLGCGACSGFYQDVLADLEKKFHADTNIVFITVCASSKADWVKALESGMYTSEVALNLYTDGKGFAHEIISHYNIKGYPRPLVIGKDGNVFNASDKDLRSKSTLEKVLHSALAVH